MEVAASVAGFVALADLLIIKYSKLVDAWKDAPSATVAIRDSLIALKPIVAALEGLNALSGEELFRKGLDIASFRRNMNALQELADDLLKPGADMKLWAKTKWTLGKNEKAKELSKNLDSAIRIFTLVLALVTQLVPSFLVLHTRRDVSSFCLEIENKALPSGAARRVRDF